ncbi:MAG: hypothetical protein A2750_03275 [Candidatus Yanofskybacteria bacterium RIFCSPHIGHO2_01_FULL_45_42]|uniref:Uncharacterized protein n=2 Tax=Candidatus Yanofskyibacteriota TaxID=1752733 RepID=A0A1F8FQB0_9BACT|nr:MAG: hypothetical protein A2750_03275 [Candidatus Yanofskybacteria bacterium RIFCSPHIGHO2_01_FULL_45_42]OGN15303.1 MAG: hypothetical protein A3J47_01710 [Candidatus Yanofskybacteria bacterium RIFCSPHIGHO2_02_FULL_43_22]
MKETKDIISPKPERPPALDRIVSTKLTEEEKRDLVVYFKEVFDKQELEELKSGKIEFSEEQISLIKLSNDLISQELAGYGINAMDVPAANVHILDAQQYKQFGERHYLFLGNSDAVTSPYDQAVVLRNRERSKYNFLTVVTHEMLHLKSFVSMNPVGVKREEAERLGVREVSETKGEDEDFIITARRQGWNVEEVKRDGECYFHNIDEALTEHLTLKIIRENGTHIFGDEFAVSESLRQALCRYIDVILTNKFLSQVGRSYFEEQQAWLEDDVLLLPEAQKIWRDYQNADEKRKGAVLLDALEHYTDKGLDKVEQFHYFEERRFFRKLIKELYEKIGAILNRKMEFWHYLLKGVLVVI